MSSPAVRTITHDLHAENRTIYRAYLGKYSALGAPQHGYAYPIWSLAVYMQSARRGSLRVRYIRRCLLTSPSPPRQESAAAAVHDR